MAKKRKFELGDEFDIPAEVEEPIMNEPEPEPESEKASVKEVQKAVKEPEIVPVVEKEEPKTQEPAPVAPKIAEQPVTAQTIVKETTVQPSQRVETRGRKKDPSTRPPKNITVNIIDLEKDLNYLVMKYKSDNNIGGNVGVSTYIRMLCEKEIAQNKDYLDKAKILFG